jgi:hypothetical protein
LVNAAWSVTSAANASLDPAKSDYPVHTVIDKLGLFPGTATNFGATNSSPVNFTALLDTYTGTNRFQLNGGGGGSAGNLLPTQRYLYFNVDGACSVKVWFKTGKNGEARTVLVTNGEEKLGSGTSTGGTSTSIPPVQDLVVFTANVTATQAAVGKIYIYGDATSSNIYKIEVTGANVITPSVALGTNDFQADASSNVFSNGKLVFVSDVKSDTKVDVYGISGILVKSLTTSSDTSFDLNTGIYIVRSKSAEGVKSAKVLIN